MTRCETNWWKNIQIRGVISHYGVNIEEAKHPDCSAYRSFNHFFTRELKESVRPIERNTNQILSPADGAVSQAGTIDGTNMIQAKNHSYSLSELLGGDENLAASFVDGNFITIYLSPRDYHRLHMPVQGKLIEMKHIPGRLFSVNTATTEVVSKLFARNERVVAVFETALGKMVLVLVGAIFVSSIETVWHGVVTPPTSPSIRNWSYGDNSIKLDQGDEMGRFNMGSTIITLFEPGRISWSDLMSAGTSITMGSAIGEKLA